MEGQRALPPRASALGFGVSIGAVLGVFVVACNALNGSGDFNIGDISGGVPAMDGGRGGDGASATGDGGISGADGGGTDVDGDGGFDPDAGIDPKLNSCGSNLVCLPDVDGWSPAVFLVAGGGGGQNGVCPPEYPVANDVHVSGGGTCNCNCSAAGGSCAGSVDSMSGPLCAGAATNLAVTTDACTTLTADLPLPVAFVAHPSGTTPTSCGATVATQLNKPRPARYCTGAVPATTGGMCDPGEICVKRPMGIAGTLACIVHDGDIACPNALALRTLLGSTITDGRSCSNTCTCKQVPCGGTLEAFSDALCATQVRSVNVDGTCTTAGAAMSGASYRYTHSSGCGVNMPATILGSETYTSPQTLCCTLAF